MKVSLQYTSKQTKQIIKEAMELYTNDAGFDTDDGWKACEGQFKQAYIKGDVVVKFGPKDQLQAEYNRWKSFRGSYLRKHISRVYGCDGKMLIQKKVKGVKEDICYCSKSEKIGQLIGFMLDFEANHGHEKGTIVFFDTDDGWV